VFNKGSIIASKVSAKSNSGNPSVLFVATISEESYEARISFYNENVVKFYY
jgi:hypothetical protein